MKDCFLFSRLISSLVIILYKTEIDEINVLLEVNPNNFGMAGLTVDTINSF